MTFGASHLFAMPDRPQILEPFGVAVARPQPHPLLAHHRSTDPSHRLKAVRRRALPIAVIAAHHPASIDQARP